MIFTPQDGFYILKFLNSYYVLFLLFFIGLTIYKKEKQRLLDYILCLLLGEVVSETIKYVVDAPRPVPMTGFRFEGSSFPSTHATVAFAGFFFFLLCLNITKRHSHTVKTKIMSILSRYVTYNVIEEKGSASELQKWEKEAIFRVFFLLSAIFVAFLRVYTGAHYLLDVIVGAGIGFCVAVPFMFYDISSRRIR